MFPTIPGKRQCCRFILFRKETLSRFFPKCELSPFAKTCKTCRQPPPSPRPTPPPHRLVALFLTSSCPPHTPPPPPPASILCNIVCLLCYRVSCFVVDSRNCHLPSSAGNRFAALSTCSVTVLLPALSSSPVLDDTVLLPVLSSSPCPSCHRPPARSVIDPLS